jgi:hypothetical protein
VLSPIEFDDEPMLLANEIDDKRADWRLSAKAETRKTMTAKRRP